MATITLTYKAKTRITPVASEIDNFVSSETNCISTLSFDITPTGTRWIEVLDGTYSYANIVDGNLSVPQNVTLTIDAFKSEQGNQNDTFSQIRLNIRDGFGGTLIDSVVLNRDHTTNIC